MISRTGLKGLAAASMVVDHVGVVLLPQLWLLRCVGRLAFPIYAFFLAQGFRYTKSRAKYLARLAGFALLSEIPFDYMVYGQAFV